MKHDHWKEQIHELLYIDFDGVKPPITFGQIDFGGILLTSSRD